jgi:hypothetical protein
MSELKATPGPWGAFHLVDPTTDKPITRERVGEYVESCTYPNDPFQFMFVTCTKPDGDYDVCHVGNGPDSVANAHLIAAAPEMYEELRDAEVDINTLFGTLERNPKHYASAREQLEKRAESIRALLAKVRGEEP